MQISSKTNYDKEEGMRNGMTAAQRLDRLKLRISLCFLSNEVQPP